MPVDLQALFLEMVRYDAGDPRRVQHFVKVHAFARQIGRMERLPEDVLATLEAAALTHDVGIRACERKGLSPDGKAQEREGPAVAEAMLARLGFERALIERVSYLVGHHHSYDAIDGADHQILVEADFLVNLFEGAASGEAIRAAFEAVFRTASGRAICRAMFGL